MQQRAVCPKLIIYYEKLLHEIFFMLKFYLLAYFIFLNETKFII